MIYVLAILIIVTSGIALLPHNVLDGIVRNQNNSSSIRKTLFLLMTFVTLFVISAFRDYSVGNDTFAYYLNYQKISEFANLGTLVESIDNEPGYLISQWLFASIGFSFRSIIILASFLNLFVISILISKKSIHPLLSVMLYLGMGFFTFEMTAFRQSIALTLCVLAYFKSREDKLAMFILFTLLAASFHISALIFLPSYLIGRFKLNKWNLGILIFTMIVLVQYRIELALFLIEASGRQYDSVQTGGLLYSGLLFASIFTGLLFTYKQLANETKYRYLFYMIFSSILLLPVATYHPAFFRVQYYFSIFLVIYVPDLLNRSFSKQSYRLLCSLLIVILGTRFIIDVLSSPSFSNFRFFWS